MAAALDYFEIVLKAGEDFKVVVTVNENGSAKDLSGWTALTSEGKLEEDGATIFTASLGFTTDGVNGQLDLEVAEADTGALQTAGNKEGVIDLFGPNDDAPTRVIRIGSGRWILSKSTTFP